MLSRTRIFIVSLPLVVSSIAACSSEDDPGAGSSSGEAPGQTSSGFGVASSGSAPSSTSSSSGEPSSSSSSSSSGSSDGGSSGASSGALDGGAEGGSSGAEADAGDADGGDPDGGATDAGGSSSSSGGAVHVCGDGTIDQGEECDDGDAAGGDGCSARCLLESGFACATPGAACQPSTCGNGQVEGLEACDDGPNDLPFDGCYRCRKEVHCTSNGCTSACGDGLLSANEQCDDGNAVSGDGCSRTCTVEAGFQCPTSFVTPAELALPVLYRDFQSPYFPSNAPTVPADEALDPAGHPDFERFVGLGVYAGLVQPALGNDGKPVFKQAIAAANPCVVADPARCGPRAQLTGAAEFAEWYHAGPRSRAVPSALSLGYDAASQTYTFDVATIPAYGPARFFPLDPGNPAGTGTGFGVQVSNVCRNPYSPPNIYPIPCTGVRDGLPDGMPHNFHFTTELHLAFTYRDPGNDVDGAELSFRGDDDAWLFVNGKLVVDLGGLHSAMLGTVKLTRAKAAQLGLVDGGAYDAALFHAERHSTASNFKLTATGFSRARSVCRVQ